MLSTLFQRHTCEIEWAKPLHGEKTQYWPAAHPVSTRTLNISHTICLPICLPVINSPLALFRHRHFPSIFILAIYPNNPSQQWSLATLRDSVDYDIFLSAAPESYSQSFVSPLLLWSHSRYNCSHVLFSAANIFQPPLLQVNPSVNYICHEWRYPWVHVGAVIYCCWAWWLCSYAIISYNLVFPLYRESISRGCS